MHIAKTVVVNYRNFRSAKFLFEPGINTIIGENGSGKTNIFRAIRLLLDENMSRSAIRLDENDFCRELGDWRGHWIIINIEFAGISKDEVIQALLKHTAGTVTGNGELATYSLIFRPKRQIRQKLAKLKSGDHSGLADLRKTITTADYESVFFGRGVAEFENNTVYKRIVGDFDAVVFSQEVDDGDVGIKTDGIMSIAKEVSFSYVQALRDVISDFSNNRTNPLISLLKGRSGNIDATKFAPIIASVKGLNDDIESLEDVQSVRKDIIRTMRETAGETYSPSAISIRSDLPSEEEKLFQSLKLFIGESDDGYEGAINELSLGGANLLYLTLKLIGFEYQKKDGQLANFILIEEPEAHIHNHIQKTLFDRIKFPNTQIIYSTHSTQISSISDVSRVNIVSRNGRSCEVFQPAASLTKIDIRNIQRYLDAIRSNLLFAKSIILVEGDAEEILIPILFKCVLGISLDEMGVSLINIRSTGFKNVAVLFHETRIRKLCAILTDLDQSVIDITEIPTDNDEIKKIKSKAAASQKSGADRKIILDEFSSKNRWINICYAPHTFEVDLLMGSNLHIAIDVVKEVYSEPPTILAAENDLKSGVDGIIASRILQMAKYEGKGWFAILLGNLIDFNTTIPQYIWNALEFVNSSNKSVFKKEIWSQIFDYRIESYRGKLVDTDENLNNLIIVNEEYRRGTKNLADVHAVLSTAFSNDPLLNFLRNK